MGWKSAFKKIVGKITPESSKGIAGAAFATSFIDPIIGIALGKKSLDANEKEKGTPASQKAAAVGTGRVEEEEAQDIVRKRLLNIGRVFTSPLGILSATKSGSQKVFS